MDEPLMMPLILMLWWIFSLAILITIILSASGKLRPELRAEIVRRTLSWLVIIPFVVGPILAGAAWTILMLFVLSLLCYREFARATGLFRERSMSLVVVLGIAALYFTVLDHWYGLFMALPSLILAVLALVAILPDRPKGYVQRVGLAALSFMLFGVSLGHLGYMANDRSYRSLIVLVFLAVQLNDVFAFCVGKSLGGPKLCPHTSPNKTVSGSLGAIVLTTALVWALTGYVFREPPLSGHGHRILLGLILSLTGQLGDLMMSSVKRDVGIKDMGSFIPGHGGFLDRFNSLLLAAPAAFHYVGYLRGFGLDQPVRIITGGG
jgi:phosphatidate cytidylyltransferase